MNGKEEKIYQILNAVIESCSMDIDDGVKITSNDILGRNRTTNVHMTRCIFVTQLLFAGYTTKTISCVIHRTCAGVRNILMSAHHLRKTSRIYVLCEAEATLKCKKLFDNN